MDAAWDHEPSVTLPTPGNRTPQSRQPDLAGCHLVRKWPARSARFTLSDAALGTTGPIYLWFYLPKKTSCAMTAVGWERSMP